MCYFFLPAHGAEPDDPLLPALLSACRGYRGLPAGDPHHHTGPHGHTANHSHRPSVTVQRPAVRADGGRLHKRRGAANSK